MEPLMILTHLRLHLARYTCLLLLIAAWYSLPARAQNRRELETALDGEYAGKVLIQRQFITGKRISYDATGKVTEGSAGPWTTDAQVRVVSVRLPRETEIEVKAQRLWLVYEADKKRFRDLLTDPRTFNERALGKGRVKELRDIHNVVITIRSSAPYDESSARAAFRNVFLAPEDHLSDFVPEYWQDFLRKEEVETGEWRGGKRRREILPASPGAVIYKVGSGVAAPRAKSSPDPEYSEAARLANLQGTVVFWLIVDPSGAVQDITIVRPLGGGLDEKSVAAVQTWKFEPALRNGEPVAVQINVEVNFRLY